MRFPLVSRSHHEEVVEALKDRLSDRDGRVLELEDELHRVHDLIWKANFGVQLYDTLKGNVAAPAPEPMKQQTAEEIAEAEIRSEEAHEEARIAVTRRLNPSKLGNEISRVMGRRMMRAAKAANPNADKIFAAARIDAEQMVTKTTN